MPIVWMYTIISVLIVSFASFAGVITLPIRSEKFRNLLIYMISLSAGALLGDAFIHLLPEAVDHAGFTTAVSTYVICGIVASFIVEKFIHWHHCHTSITDNHVHSFAWMNLFGDAVHNFIDGLVIGAAYFVSLPAGIATTVAVVLHEIPQEIGDFAVLIHGGFKVKKAVMLNLLTAFAAVLGAILVLLIGPRSEAMLSFLVPFAAGSFIYIAATDLIPELHKETCVSKSILQLFWFLVGIGMMFLLLLVG